MPGDLEVCDVTAVAALKRVRGWMRWDFAGRGTIIRKEWRPRGVPRRGQLSSAYDLGKM